MRFGLMVPTFSFERLDSATAARIKDFAVRAEALGFEALWTAEHLLTAGGLYGVAWLSPLLCLAHVAAVTRDIKIGTNTRTSSAPGCSTWCSVRSPTTSISSIGARARS